MEGKLNLVTIEDIKKIKGFEGRSCSAIHSFIKVRGIKYKEKKSKAGKSGGLNFLLFDESEIIEALPNHPFRSKKNPSKCGRKAGVRPKRETDEPLLGKTQPFRNIKCPKYQECLAPFIKKDGKLNCSVCENANLIDEHWSLK